LLRFLGGPDPGNLALDRREELPARSQLRLDPLLLRCLLRDDRPLLRVRFPELLAVTMLASWCEVELTASIRLSRSSRLDAPSSTESVELSSVDV
jgi:hypothetical protein